ncbi:YciI family protein [Actinoalloteichus hymeniacidonis]|uniref:YCII-related domain-containing protein n=1 Tax=Actinoalloteichus hymeniacidonis TaxID=340345 RepID=A0AAC9N0Q5_9PSEU|nr:YciI family protein [Actinoalloteichus hymeniacidonis]AOS65849.1 hypothetical protein TL08_25355 [Actinoalloteichus hymeniacidonis]MBB5906059.1 hypothetical protein [Actinoalloteichus hymeniacidonis]
MRYLIQTYASQQDYEAMAGIETAQPAWTPAQLTAMTEFMTQLNADLVASGELIEARGLAAPSETRQVRGQGNAPVVTVSPYPADQPVLAGYWVVECDSIDRAVEIAAWLGDCPLPEQAVPHAFADVRPISDAPPE